MTRATTTLDAFLHHLEEHGYSPTTRRVRARFLAEFLHHATAAEDATVELTTDELMQPARAEAWLTDAKAGKTRQRNTLHGRDAESSDATDRVRRITYNTFAGFAGTPHRLDVPPNTTGERLDPDEAYHLLHEASVRRPAGNAVDVSVWIRSAALAALVVASGRTVAELARLRTDDLHLGRKRPCVRLGDTDIELGVRAEDLLRRWLRHRTAIITHLQGSDPGHLWIPVKPGRPRHGITPPPPGTQPAAIRTLRAAHRTLTMQLLGRPLPPGALRQHEGTSPEPQGEQP